MSPAPNDLFLAVTTRDGNVYTTDRAASSGSWSAFQPVPSLAQPGRKNLAVTATFRRQVCAVNDAVVRQLRYTHENGSWSAPVRLATGVAPACANIGDGSLSLAALALGAPTQPGWSFGLPLFLLKDNEKDVQSLGDQTAGVNPGVLDPMDTAVALDIAGAFNDGEKKWHLCLATKSGKAFYAFKDGSPLPTRLEQIPFFASGHMRSVSCALGHEGLHVCVATDEGKILHIIRRPDGRWSDVGDVNAATGCSELFKQVAISHYDAPGLAGSLHVAGVTRTEGLLHAIRTAEETADPPWSPFTDVKAHAGDKGAVTSVDIGVAA
jgi:hypothetical protein